ncbi:MAG: ABC transporter permease [Thermoanaerobaculia bacterium]
MTTLYTSDAQLRHPARFFAAAADDLLRSPAVAWRLFRSNLRARHRRAWLGYLWLLLPTLGTTAVWVYVRWRGLVDIPSGGMPYPVYVLTGMVFWQTFADALHAPLQQLTAGKQMLTRSRVPQEALILAGLYEVLLNCAIRVAVLGVVLFAFGMPVATTALLLPFGILALALLGLALGLWLAPLGMLYDDVGRAITLGTTFWMFLTPVLYPTPRYGILRLNPVTPLLETSRAWLLGGQTNGRFVPVVLASLVALTAAWLFHRLARPHVVARLG